MSVTLDSLTSKVRYLIGDASTTYRDVFTYDTSSIFTLSESNGVSITSVLVNDVEIGTSEYSYSSTTNKVTITKSLVSGDTTEIRYTSYSNYSDTELKDYIQAALVHLSINNYFTFLVRNSTILPEPTDNEENLIVAITAVLIDVPVRMKRLPDITITYPENLGKYDRIRQMIASFKRDVHGIFFVS